MTIVLTGQNDFAVNSDLKILVDDFAQEFDNLSIEKYEGSEIKYEELKDTVASMPFLSKRRMVIVHNLSNNKEANDQIEQFLDSISDTTDLIIVERRLDKRTKLFSTLKKRTDFREYQQLDEKKLIEWIVDKVNAGEGVIKPNDAAYLIARVGSNQMSLNGELDKLLNYNRHIDRKSIEELCEPLPQSSTFDLLDAAFAGNQLKTFALYEDQRKQQVEPQAIVGMLGWQLHVLSIVKLNENEDPAVIASRAKLNPYVVRKTLALARKLSLAKLKSLLGSALNLDIRLKTETIDADDAVQHFLLTI